MADWPDTDELKKVIDVDDDGGDDWTTTLNRVLASAIARVKSDVGIWDDVTDEPDDNLAQAALRMAELIALKPSAAATIGDDPTYQRLLHGHKRRFGFS
jgi:hypothetical protein